MASARYLRRPRERDRFWATELVGCDLRPPSPQQDRALPAAEVLAKVRRHAGKLGITRIGELTGLDTLGVPVALATRPNSFSLSLSLGKGLERDLALTSAAMEAAELAVAERRPSSLYLASLSAMAGTGADAIDLSRIARCQPDLLDPDAEIDWIEGLDIMTGRRIAVPWSLVGLDHRVDPPGYHPAFEVATDGLASGSTPAEAALHAICELIERDAYALLEMLPKSKFLERCFRPGFEGRSALSDAVQRIETSGHEVRLVDMTSDIGVPAHLAVLSAATAERRAELGGTVEFIGCGCHIDPARSMARAITEAAQARTAFIAGARDDFQSAWRGDQEAAGRTSVLVDEAPIRSMKVSPQRETGAGATVGERIDQLLSALRAADIGTVAVVDLSVPELEFSVVRVLIPDLQVPLHGSRSQVTVRGLRQLLKAMS